MRVLFLSTWFPYPPDNGSKLRAYYLMRAMSREHQVSLVAFQPEPTTGTGATTPHLPANVQVWDVPADPFRYVKLPSLAKYLSPIPLAVWPSAEMRRTVADVVAGTAWDVVIALETPAAQYAQIPKKPVRIFDIDNPFSLMAAERLRAPIGTVGRLKARISLYKTRRYEASHARRFDACMTVSPLEADYIRKLTRGTDCRVELVPNGVDCERNQPGLVQPHPDALVYNGSLTYSANYDAMQWFLAAIYPLIKAQAPDVTLSITGSTQKVDPAGLALDKSVTLTGYVDDIRLPVAGAAVCVVPIRQGGGTRLKILEAMALGTPVVATRKGAEGLEVVDGEHLLLADDPVTFAAATLSLIQNPELRARLAANARRLVAARYDWAQIGLNFVDVVEEVVVARARAWAN